MRLSRRESCSCPKGACHGIRAVELGCCHWGVGPVGCGVGVGCRVWTAQACRHQQASIATFDGQALGRLGTSLAAAKLTQTYFAAAAAPTCACAAVGKAGASQLARSLPRHEPSAAAPCPPPQSPFPPSLPPSIYPCTLQHAHHYEVELAAAAPLCPLQHPRPQMPAIPGRRPALHLTAVHSPGGGAGSPLVDHPPGSRAAQQGKQRRKVSSAVGPASLAAGLPCASPLPFLHCDS